MLVRARHTTRFRYSEPVVCEPLVVRLRPREDATQRLHRFALTFVPEPAGISQQLDFENNVVAQAWFREPTRSLEVAVAWQVETLRTNPFDFVLPSEFSRLPWRTCNPELPLWQAYNALPGQTGPVAVLAQQLAQQSQHDTVDFLVRLARGIHHDHEPIVRHHGPPWSTAETLARKQGSCRDLALVFIEACRTQGIPARFVSGYALGSEQTAEQHLHAWAEAYLPGAGWRGFDPSSGLAVSDAHIAVAAAITPQGAAPTWGSFRSNSAQATLEVAVQLQSISASDIAPDRVDPPVSADPTRQFEAAISGAPAAPWHN